MTPAEMARYVNVEVDRIVQTLNVKAQSRARTAVNELRNSAITTLSKDGTGRRYGKHIASSPGQTPAPDTGSLRMRWRQFVFAEPNLGGVKIIMRIKSDVKYSEFLEKGTRKMAARPYKQKIKNDALPKINALYANL